jgi:hypothetical protein
MVDFIVVAFSHLCTVVIVAGTLWLTTLTFFGKKS